MLDNDRLGLLEQERDEAASGAVRIDHRSMLD